MYVKEYTGFTLEVYCVFVNRFTCLVKLYNNYIYCNTDNIIKFLVTFQQQPVPSSDYCHSRAGGAHHLHVTAHHTIG